MYTPRVNNIAGIVVFGKSNYFTTIYGIYTLPYVFLRVKCACMRLEHNQLNFINIQERKLSKNTLLLRTRSAIS